MARTRVSLSLDSRLVKELDKRTGGAGAETTRSALVEQALRKYLGAGTTVIVLAGGPAKALYVPELRTYRPLVKLAGGKLLIENTLERFRDAGVRRAIVAGSREVNSAVFSALGNGSEIGVAIEYVDEARHAGSMNTLATALAGVAGTFAFAACDHYFDFDITGLRDFHQQMGRGVSLALYAGTAFEWRRTSVVELDGQRIARYYEKPARPTSHVIATMLGFAEAEAFDGLEQPGSLDAVFARLAERGLLNGFLAHGNFVNVHLKKDVETVNKLLGGGRK